MSVPNTPSGERPASPSAPADARGLEALFELCPIPIAVAEDPECRVVRANPVLAEMLGLSTSANASVTPGTSATPPFRIRIGGVDVAPEDLPMQRCVRTGEPVRGVAIEVVRADGRMFSMINDVVPLRDDRGAVRGCISVCTDVTEQLRTEDQLRHSERRLRRIADSAPVQIAEVSADERFRFVNRAYAERYGLAPEDIVGRPVREVLGEETYRSARPHIARTLAGESVDYEIPITVRDGEIRHLRCRYQPEFDASGAVTGYVAALIDVTERRRAEDALLEGDRRKDEFLATLAHELRNPLAPMRNAMHLVRAAGDDDALRERAYAILERQIAQMRRLVEDLLDVSRITSGKLELRREPVALATLVGNAVEIARPAIDGARHELRVALPPGPVLLTADSARIAQALANVLTNSAKYTPPGGLIELGAALEGDAVRIGVRDSGIGIPAQDLPRVFDMFAQGDHSLDRAQGGLGVGLTLVKRMVELHGGDVSIESEPGRGTLVVMRLPARAAEAASVPAASEPRPGRSAGRRRILVVDDNTDAVSSLAALLELEGHDVRTAIDGHEGLRWFESFRPEVVFLDLGMPGLDGLHVARRIRARPNGERTVLVALTGWGQNEDHTRTRDAGFDHHLVKPVDPSVVLDLVSASFVVEG